MATVPFAGRVGDYVFRLSPAHGRQAAAQVALLLRCFFVFIIFHVIPREPESFWYYLVLSTVVGVFAGWPTAVNRPILAEIVKPQHKATVFSLVCSVMSPKLCGISSICVFPLV